MGTMGPWEQGEILAAANNTLHIFFFSYSRMSNLRPPFSPATHIAGSWVGLFRPVNPST